MRKKIPVMGTKKVKGEETEAVWVDDVRRGNPGWRRTAQERVGKKKGREGTKLCASERDSETLNTIV